MTSDRVRVTFDDPENGWIGISIKTENGVGFQESFSYTPYDSFLELITAISLISQGDGDAVVRWNAEPTEYEWKFHRSGDRVQLGIEKHPDHRGERDRKADVVSLSGTFDEIVKPFWRSLQNLRSRFSTEELGRRWHRSFPPDQLDRLFQRLRG